MGADASIYQQFLQPPRSVADYAADMDQRELTQLRMQGQRGQNALLDVTRQGQAQAAQSQMDDRNALQRVASSWAPTTTVAERAASLRSTGRPGLFTIADQLETQDGTRRKTEADIGKVGAETAEKAATTVDKALARYRNALDFIDTKQGAVRWLQAQYADPVVGAHMASMGTIEDAASRIPDDPQGMEQWRQRAAMGMEKFIADQTARRGQDTTRLTQLEVNAATNATSRDNNRATVGATVRGQNLTDARERGKVKYEVDGAGNTVALPEIPVPGAVVRGTAVAAPGGGLTPMQGGGKPMNDTQAKALLFAGRMQAAETALQTANAKGVNQPGMIKRMAEGTGDLVPFIGDKIADTAGTLTNFTQSSDQQQVEQAQRDFINAVLRRESGAAIAASEFSSARKQYFPQPNDGDAVIKQKAANRALATRLMLEEVPQQYRRNLGSAATAPTGKPAAGGGLDLGGGFVLKP